MARPGCVLALPARRANARLRERKAAGGICCQPPLRDGEARWLRRLAADRVRMHRFGQHRGEHAVVGRNTLDREQRPYGACTRRAALVPPVHEASAALVRASDADFGASLLGEHMLEGRDLSFPRRRRGTRWRVAIALTRDE